MTPPPTRRLRGKEPGMPGRSRKARPIVIRPLLGINAPPGTAADETLSRAPDGRLFPGKPSIGQGTAD